jgi:hypothetical protein
MLEAMDYTRALDSSKQHELPTSPQTRALDERAIKKLADTAQLSPMGQSGWELRESQQGSSTSAASSTAGGAFGAQFLPAVGSYRGVGGVVQ